MRNALVIDDSSTMRLILSRILSGLDFNTSQAVDGLDALEKLDGMRGALPEVVLVDWNMPNMTGIEFVRAVRARPEYADVRLMMVTTETEPERIVQALEAGADEYVMKPFDGAAVQAKLELLGLPAQRAGDQ